MANTVIGLFESREAAQGSVNGLIDNGFANRDIHISSGSDIVEEKAYGKEEDKATFIDPVKDFFRDIGLMSKADGEDRYMGKSTDSYVLVNTATDQDADRAAYILNQYGSIDIDEYAKGKKAPVVEEPVPVEPRAEAAPSEKPEVTIPVMEEELDVSKRITKHGGVRIYTHMTSHPVEEDVHLHKEHVRVERHPVDRPVSESEMNAFKESTMEFTETSEEPVVSKRAHIKEEVTVSKESMDTTETIHETLRGTEVEVVELSEDEDSEFASYESELKKEAGTMYGASYDELRPYYRYGYHVGHDPRFHDGDWSSLEPQIKDDWEAHNYGPWDQYKDVVRSGWERAVHHH